MINKIKNNKTVKQITPFLKETSTDSYIVGGFIRDTMLDKESCDIDIVVPKGHACMFSKDLADKINGYFVELDDINEIYRVVFEDKTNYIDIADCVGKTIEEDLKRRDFTMNSLAYDIQKERIIDINGGEEDIKNAVIKEVCAKNITDDPIRILRAYRFQSELGFGFSETLKTVIRENTILLNNTAKERINAELVKLFGGKYAHEVLAELNENNILEMIFPETTDIRKIPKNSHHHLDLIHHSIETVKQVQLYYEHAHTEVQTHLNDTFAGGQKRLAYLKIAAFLHDVGKPSTWQIEPETNRHRFIMHDSEGAKLIVPTLKSLKFSKKQIAYMQKIIKNHIYPAGVVTSDEVSEKAYFRFYRKMEDEVIDLIAIAYADRMSALGEDITQEMINKNIFGLNKLLEKYLQEKSKLAPLPKLLNGHEIMKILNIKASPKLGEMIDKLYEAQISGEINTKKEAIDFVKTLA